MDLGKKVKKLDLSNNSIVTLPVSQDLLVYKGHFQVAWKLTNMQTLGPY